MPVATVRGVEINYEVLGQRGPCESENDQQLSHIPHHLTIRTTISATANAAP